MSTFLLIVVSIIALLTIASYCSIIAARFRFPYTILLFIIGVALVSAQKYFPQITFITNLELSKDLVFFIFLPTLIFESGYNMNYQKVIRDIGPITGLATLSLFISTIIIGLGFKFFLGFFGFDIPYMVSFLFGAIISATDPVAVMAIFKEVGVPKRIMYLFEGESLMNDGTAVALFFIILGIIESGAGLTTGTIMTGVVSFLSMVIGGVIFGVFMGVVFSKLIQWVKHSWAELTLTLILAHTTFILAELISEHFAVFKVSAIIATTLASITVGNYGRWKISKHVREMMDTTWGYFAFISNSLIFLLMGMMIGDLDFHIQELFIPIAVGIVVVVIARAISVLSVLTPMNAFLQHKIPFAWQKLLAWGSLRGAIAITMLLFIPENFAIPGWTLEFTVKEFLSVVVISCIVFSLIIKAISIRGMIEKMGMSCLSRIEEFTFHQLKEIIDKSILRRLAKIEEKHYVPEQVSSTLIKKYETDDEKELMEIEKCCLRKAEFENLLKRYALGIERSSALNTFESKQIDERTLKRILFKIEKQYLRIEMGQDQIKQEDEQDTWLERFKNWMRDMLYCRKPEQKTIRDYVFYRTRSLIASQVIKELRRLKEDLYSESHQAFGKVIRQYESWHDSASKKMYKIEEQMKDLIHREEITLLNNHLIYLEQDLIEKLHNKHIMNSKVYSLLKKSFWSE